MCKHRLKLLLPVAVCSSAWLLPALAARATGAPESIPSAAAGSWLVLPPVGRSGRAVFHQDALEARIVEGAWQAPNAGDRVSLPDGSTREWEAAAPGADGMLRHAALRGGYACWEVRSATRKVALLETSGSTMLYANGAPRPGDPYENGMVVLPVLLQPGMNTFLFACGRGEVRARLLATHAEAMLDTRDTTLPDLVRGQTGPGWGALLLLNGTERPAEHLRIRCTGHGAREAITDLPRVLPLGLRKVAFRLDGRAPAAGEKVERDLVLERKVGDRYVRVDGTRITLRVRKPGETYRRTFRSDIDGSVQYYAVRPAVAPSGAPPDPHPALVLSLHGASVEAIGQADAYSSKSWATIVAPTNRRPFGFDWEDWGRLDALEVLERAQRELHTDPRRVYLTGHSMGGHGTWILGATYPDRFAALGPSAGWISFWTYAGGPRVPGTDRQAEALQRANNPSDTLALSRNYAAEGIYVLHGDADDNVPVQQARTMRDRLATFHRDFQYFEQPGAGHWWDRSDEPGADCVDWAPMFDLFARHRLPAGDAVREVDFTTASPGVSSRCYWAEIRQQTEPLKFSSVRLRRDPGKRRITGTTENVAELALEVPSAAEAPLYTVELDGQKVEGIARRPGTARLYFRRDGDRWLARVPSQSEKGPQRYGPFKEAFRNRMLFVYGTHGTPEENSWALAKARYDAETFWYRGNGSVDVIPDTAFSPTQDPDRNLVLYGNFDTNSAGGSVPGPISVKRGRISYDGREESEAGRACLFLSPRAGSDRALVAVIGGTDLVGMRLTDRCPYFVSGVGVPDYLDWDRSVLIRGLAGVHHAGYFGRAWDLRPVR